MKKQTLVLITFFALIFICNNIYSQVEEYPTHLFLGTWVMRTDKDTTTEKWSALSPFELSGQTIYADSVSSFLAEILSIKYINGELNYCATVMEENPEKPQGDICFVLAEYKDMKFTFENPKHDFPQRIIYDFSGYGICKARVENQNSAFDFIYRKEYDPFTSYWLEGKFLKENFVTKADRKLNDVFDYFFEIQGIKYFIKFSDSSVKKDEIDRYLNQPVHAAIMFRNGLWDTDDRNVQSRIGNYISVAKVNEK
ncbi:MAG: DUF6265 family protein [Ignavibacteria bacterium]|nr:DUF6265 family protein [Ignavibacteria bacterium]